MNALRINTGQGSALELNFQVCAVVASAVLLLMMVRFELTSLYDSDPVHTLYVSRGHALLAYPSINIMAIGLLLLQVQCSIALLLSASRFPYL